MTSPTQTFTAREFNHDTGRAKRAAQIGPVYVTDRGRPSFVLLSYEHYVELAGGESLVDILCRTPGVGEIDFEVERNREVASVPDLD